MSLCRKFERALPGDEQEGTPLDQVENKITSWASKRHQDRGRLFETNQDHPDAKRGLGSGAVDLDAAVAASGLFESCKISFHASKADAKITLVAFKLSDADGNGELTVEEFKMSKIWD